jgi:large subunit ribosomal protein L25
MAELTLEVTQREKTGKEFARKLRREGKVPAIVYGGNLEPSAIFVDRKTLTELIGKSEHGIRSVFRLKVIGTDRQRHAMIKQIEIDPLSRKPIHVDFVRVMMDEVVKLTIPVHLAGTAVGVRSDGGMLEFHARELHVECLPTAIPDTIEIDVTELGVGEILRVSDVKVTEGVKILDDPERVVVGVTHARVEAEPEAAPVEEGAAEPEVIRKGKTEEEE